MHTSCFTPSIQVVKLNFPANLTVAFLLNSPNFSESCLPTKFARVVNLLEVVTYGSQVNPEKLGDLLLVEPKRLGLIKNLNSDRPFLGLIQNEFSFVGFFRFSDSLPY